MNIPLSELHTHIIYVLFGYTLIFPLLMGVLKVFKIEDPLQRLRLYLLAFLTPPAAFIIYHTVLIKRCQAGLPIFTTDGAFHFLCTISTGMLSAILPLGGILLLVGTLKAGTAALMLRRLESENPQVDDNSRNSITKMIQIQSSSLGIKPPRVVFSSKEGFAAFTTGLLKPVLVINKKLPGKLNEQELAVVISHELIHISQRDTLKSWFLHLVRDITFFNPISNMLLNKYLAEKELLCDEKAANLIKVNHRDFAAVLLKIWRSLMDQQSTKLGLVSAFGGRGSMENRIEKMLLNTGTERKMPGLVTPLLGIIIFSTTLLALGLVC
ncbi:MAG: M56 family metallopeptidase [Bacillota bacterium]|nr:M56 family metallopeptidase [Bacillota bacterium]